MTHFIQRWMFSTNHKDIGSMYFIFYAFSNVLGSCFSLLIRMECAQHGNQILGGNHQQYSHTNYRSNVPYDFFRGDASA
jgi:heme/copper-type cytochrome/quinol oxidase subunit 1